MSNDLTVGAALTPTPAPAVNTLRFVVHGVPAPQGSHRAFVVAGKARITEGNSGNHALWRNQVTLAALNALEACEITEPLDGPLELDVLFRFPMPKSRAKWQRNLGYIPKSTAPDLDKLVRTVGDSLTAGGVITDDARITSIFAQKVEVLDLWTGADICVRVMS